MRRIDQFCQTIMAAEKLQENLYNEYNNVQCVHTPMFSEAGVYVFMCE